jgi:cytochrome c6
MAADRENPPARARSLNGEDSPVFRKTTVAFATFAVVSLATAANAAPASGAKLFADNCAACHQPRGQGVPGAFPKLAGSSFVQGPGHQVVRIVTHGKGGMPTFRNDLNAEQVAAVVSYIRTSWGNKGAPVTVADARAVRGAARSENASAALQAH